MTSQRRCEKGRPALEQPGVVCTPPGRRTSSYRNERGNIMSRQTGRDKLRKQHLRAHLQVERLEDRNLLSAAPQAWIAVVPNDPNFGSQYALNNTGQTGGRVDADIDAPE